jgi:hypothetical protein
MAKAIALVLVALSVACGRSAPEHFSVDSSFSESEQETLRAAVGAWCDAAGWCPTETLYAERAHFRLVDDIPEDSESRAKCPEGQTCETGGTNTGDEILIARNGIPSLDVLWMIAAHEAGHFCTEHTSTGLMAAYQDVNGEFAVDAVAVAAWHEGCP